MQEIISCPSCHRKLQVPESLIGQDVQCPTCGATFVGAAGAPAAAPGPAVQSHPGYPAPAPRPPRGAYDDRRPYRDDYDDYDRPRYGRGPRRDLLPHRGSAVLTLGILSLIPCAISALILGIIAWVMGQSDLREIRAGRMDPEGEGTTKAGWICGIIGTCLYGSLVVVWLLIVMLRVGAGPRF
jgi:hypothetical protein